MADLPEGFDLEALLAPIPGEAPQGTDIREDFSAASPYNRLRDAPPPTIYIPITEQRSPRLELGTFELRFGGPAASAVR